MGPNGSWVPWSRRQAYHAVSDRCRREGRTADRDQSTQRKTGFRHDHFLTMADLFKGGGWRLSELRKRYLPTARGVRMRTRTTLRNVRSPHRRPSAAVGPNTEDDGRERERAESDRPDDDVAEEPKRRRRAQFVPGIELQRADDQ